MSRFNNPKILTAPPRQRTPLRLPDSKSKLFVEVRPNLAQSLCFLAVSAYLLSGYLNDFVYHFGRNKAYLSTATTVLMPILFAFTRSARRGLEIAAGKWWLAFAGWLALAVPFSVWLGGSASMFFNYLPKSYMLFFFIAASAVTVRQCRRLMYVLGIGAFLVILSCMVFGESQSGRFSIAGSIFFANANELGLQLALNVMILMFSFSRKSGFAKVASATGIALSSFYMLKTGSRGVLLAVLGACAIGFLLSRRKARLLAISIPLLAVVVAITPAPTRHRLTFILSGVKNVSVETEEDASALDSQLQREQLLRTSIAFAFAHPFLGVGPGEFEVAVAGDAERTGQHADWRGTHNTYTQVACEAGLPAFIFYVATLLVCFRLNYCLYAKTRGRRGLEDVAGLSYCLLLCSITYAISTFFFHIAYSSYLPMIAGLSAAVYLNAQPILRQFARGSR